jgi:choice-of-anchor B domain-containing protein
MKYALLIFLAFLSNTFWAQLNVDSLSHIDYQALHGANLNDVWGYVDEVGNEYAIVGTSKGTSIVNVTNPTNPQEIFWIAGTESIWRDPCVYGNYAYITTEAQDGLLIIDLSPLPLSNNLPTSVYTGPLGNPWQSAHTCFMDNNGYGYIFGSNRGNGGVIILNLQSNPMSPTEVGQFDNWYVHDGYVRNDTMFLAHIADGFFSLVDVSNKSNPLLIGTKTTPNTFTHNIWPSDNGQYVFTTDEISGAFIAAYDITDPSNIFEVDRIQNSPGQGVIPHNTHVLGNYLVTSYYSDGIVIHDATHPNNLIKVGQFDTYPTQTAGFDGCWGVYPFLPSGTILASDITKGLFILGPTYVPAAYLEGIVTDASILTPVDNVKVQIIGHDQSDYSQINGNYATGINASGTYNVSYSKVGYFPQVHTVSLPQGQVTNFNVQLTPIPQYNLTVNVVESVTGIPISDAQISLKAELIEHTGISNGLGQENLTLFYQEPYWISVGKWGYYTNCFEQSIENSTLTITVELTKGYHDEFTFDLGWQVSGTATTGNWERGIPFGSSTNSAPSVDMDFDCNGQAYVTGNDASLNPDVDDVDGGFTLLTSPSMDLTAYSDPHINFSRWFYCMHGNPPDDTLKVIVSNGLTSVVIDQTGSVESDFYQWIPKSIRLLDYISLTNSMQVSFRTSDLDPNVNITEAGIDYFHVSNANVLDLSTQDPLYPSVYPNPFSSSFFIDNAGLGLDFQLYNTEGKVLFSGEITTSHQMVELNSVPSGFYILFLGERIFKVVKN